MQTKIFFLTFLLSGLAMLGFYLALRLSRCPACQKRGAKIIEKRQYWYGMKCHHCECQFTVDRVSLI